jgi:hypothetical protein
MPLVVFAAIQLHNHYIVVAAIGAQWCAQFAIRIAEDIHIANRVQGQAARLDQAIRLNLLQGREIKMA